MLKMLLRTVIVAIAFLLMLSPVRAASTTLLVVDGNSLSYDRGDIWNWPNCTDCSFAWPTWLGSLLRDSSVEIVNLADPGATTPMLTARAGSVVDPYLATSTSTHVLLIWEVANDLCVGGASPATAVSHLAQYVAGRRAVGWTVLVATVIPRAEVCSGVDFEAARTATNTMLRRQWATIGADALVDLAAADQFLLGDSWGHGAFLGPLYLSDHVHLSDQGSHYIASLVAQSPAVLAVFH